MRKANEAIIEEWYPIPTVDEALHNLNQSAMFSKFDLKRSYDQLELDPESRGTMTFVTHTYSATNASCAASVPF